MMYSGVDIGSSGMKYCTPGRAGMVAIVGPYGVERGAFKQFQDVSNRTWSKSTSSRRSAIKRCLCKNDSMGR